ncbi:MAG: hypothetical protein K8S55_05200 [Phycisphaerae bacterium]|nr:hypothetical protein [Phycisphaerae bacterium]
MKKIRDIKKVYLCIAVAAIVIMAICVCGWILYVKPRLQSLVNTGGTESLAPNGRAFMCRYTEDGFGRLRLVLFVNKAPGKGKDLKSNVWLRAKFPPDPDWSGLYIDHKKQKLSPGLQVYVVTNEVECTKLNLSDSEKEQLESMICNRGCTSQNMKDYYRNIVIPALADLSLPKVSSEIENRE